jgi:TonB family protein
VGGGAGIAGDESLADLEIMTAGPSNPWDKFIPCEIKPVALSINPNPKYPSIAAKSGIAGKVYVWVLVGVDGKVAEWNIVHVSAPGLGFEEAVEEIIGKWQFTPAIQGNSPVAVWVNIPFSFKMKN